MALDASAQKKSATPAQTVRWTSCFGVGMILLHEKAKTMPTMARVMLLIVETLNELLYESLWVSMRLYESL
jgi:hypothetical protein